MEGMEEVIISLYQNLDVLRDFSKKIKVGKETQKKQKRFSDEVINYVWHKGVRSVHGAVIQAESG